MDAIVRPARPSDKAPLMSFIKDVWGGHDYIPQVWDQWLSDRHGRMFVVEVGGVPVGMNRVQFLEDGSAWFEGVRVHPDYRGQGLASLLGENSMKVARERGIDVFRLTSGSHNKPAHRQIARIGFNEISRFSVYEPTKKGSGDRSGVRRARLGELAEVMLSMRGSKEYQLGAGVFWHDFTAVSLNSDVARRLVEEGAVWYRERAVAVTRLGAAGSWEEICFVGGPPTDALSLVTSLVGRNRKAKERWVFVPQGSPIIHVLREAGFKRNFSNVLFERRATKG
jgi:GNAT superfamily N-acetyltransferase